MPYGKVKVYSDGGHYIGIPYEPEEVITVKEHVEESATPLAENTDGSNTALAEREKPDTIPKERRMTRKELFEELYQKSADMKRRERKEFICNEGNTGIWSAAKYGCGGRSTSSNSIFS